MTGQPLRFTGFLTLALATAFGIHLFVLHLLSKPLLADLIMRSYVINLLLAAVIFFALYRLREKFKNQIGFLFMGGSFLKFILFFLVFYPYYKSDGELQRSEFAAFFVPYAIALVLETFFASKMLHDLEKGK